MFVNLDMWVAEQGAASQLFALDTVVATPLITGDHAVPDPGINETFGIANLDRDVVAVVSGPSATGVVLIHDFFNNQDGTGSFQVDFAPAVPTRSLTIIAIDDVDNRSNESPIFLVQSAESAKLGETFSIRPSSSISTETCQSLLDSMPKTGFVLKRQYTVPYSFNTTAFDLRAITPGMSVQISVIRRDLAGKADETQQYVVVPDQTVLPVKLRLGRGLNTIVAVDSSGRSDTIVVAATTYAAVLCSYAREIYNYSKIRIDEQETAVYSPVSTRLAEPLLPFSNLLPDVRSQQILATKLAIRSLVESPGKQSGVRDLLTALTLSTPIFVQQVADPLNFEPAVRPLVNRQEGFAGVEAHVWPANQCIRKWLAFIRYINNLKVFRLVSISEYEVAFYDENGDLQRHRFDFGEDACSLTNLALQSICFENIDVRFTIFSESDMRICAATYPLDMRPTPDFPIRPVDHEDEIDPGFNGYVDFSATGHWDSGRLLDSQGAMPAADSGYLPCGDDTGYLVVPLLMAGQEHQIDNQMSMVITGYSITPCRWVSMGMLIIAPSISVGMSLSIVESRLDIPMAVSIRGTRMSVGMDISVSRWVAAGMNISIIDPMTKTVGLDVVISS